MIEARNLRKTYGPIVAVDNLSFDVRPGVVTGLLGPEGAGKTTTIGLMLGLVSGGGYTRFNGVSYRRMRQPLRHVGLVGDPRAFHPGRRARSHLLMLAASAGIGPARVDEVLNWVGLAELANRRQRAFSSAMSGRLALGAALLGDPRVLILDEPAAVLDPAGATWLRGFLRAFAAEGRTVLIAGADFTSLAQFADHMLVLSRGRLVADEGSAVFASRGEFGEVVLVRTPHLERLGRVLEDNGGRVRRAEDYQLAVAGLDRATVGDLAFRNGIVLHQLATGVAAAHDGAAHPEPVGGLGGDGSIPLQVPPRQPVAAAGLVDANRLEETQSMDVPRALSWTGGWN